MKKIFAIITLFCVFGQTFADETITAGSWTTKTGYELYTHNVETYCVKEFKNTGEDKEWLVTLNESEYFQKIEEGKKDFFEKAKKAYEKNMDTIYGCATYSSYYRQLKLIKEEFLKNPKLNSRLRSKIEQKMKEIDGKIKKLDGTCKNKDQNENFVKEAVLRQVSYETCKYDFYLTYSAEEYQKLGNLGENENGAILTYLSDYQNSLAAIDAERNKIYNIYPLVYKAYVDYENYIGNHLLLEFLEEEFKIFRLGLHKTLNPINQVVYKISNAMRK